MENGLRLIALLLFFLSFTTVASAQGDGGAASAGELFRKGAELFEAGEYADAAEAFREALALKPSWKLYYNIGQSEAAAKQPGRALEAFEIYLAKGGDDVSDARREEVVSEIDSLRKLVGMLDVEAPRGAEIYVNGDLRGTAPLAGPIPVAASVEHILHIKLNGVWSPERRARVMGRQTLTVTFSEADSSVDDDEPLSTREEGGQTAEGESGSTGKASKIKKWGFATLGIGGATLVAGGVTGVLTLVKDGDLQELCKDGCSKAEAGDLPRTVDKLSLSTNVLLGVGGAVTVAGVLMVTVFAKRAARKERAPVALYPYVNQHASGAVLSWTF